MNDNQPITASVIPRETDGGMFFVVKGMLLC
jgi:hypothetical protein